MYVPDPCKVASPYLENKKCHSLLYENHNLIAMWLVVVEIDCLIVAFCGVVLRHRHRDGWTDDEKGGPECTLYVQYIGCYIISSCLSSLSDIHMDGNSYLFRYISNHPHS